MPTLVRSLDHIAYRTPIRLAKYNGRVTVLRTHGHADGAKVLRRVNPDWTHADHFALAARHAQEAMRLNTEYSQLLDTAAMETFGRPFKVSDYKISAIGCEQFSEPAKEALRFAAHASTNHMTLSLAHRRAAGKHA